MRPRQSRGGDRARASLTGSGGLCLVEPLSWSESGSAAARGDGWSSDSDAA